MVTGASANPVGIGMARAIERYFNVALYLLVLTGFGALASTGGYLLLTLAELILRTTEPRRALPPYVILPEVLILIAVRAQP